jgi:aminoglycoside phosphotransferase (APT) family kinase protein
VTHPSVGDLALTMRGAIANALAEGLTGTATGLLGDVDLGLQAISALAGSPAGNGEVLDLSALPSPRVIAGGDLPRPGAGPFEDYLRARTGSALLQLRSVERISGGFSRDMIRLRCAIGNEARDIVLRREVPGGLLEGVGVDVAGEYPLMRVALAGGVPLAAPLWLESDAAILGQPFVAMECAGGRCLGTSLGAASEIGRSQLQALAAMLARLHLADWRGAVPQQGDPTGPAAAASALLNHWDAYWRTTPMSPVPLLDEAMRWLRDHLPGDGEPPCLTHGDVGFHNIMADDGGFTALLDWEMALVASPAKDLAHVRPSVERLVDWTTFVGWYREAGGTKITAAELHWFEVFRAFSMTLVCHVALAKLSDPIAARIDYFRLGFLALPVFSAQLAELLSVG